jgi:hypothetical protein
MWHNKESFLSIQTTVWIATKNPLLLHLGQLQRTKISILKILKLSLPYIFTYPLLMIFQYTSNTLQHSSFSNIHKKHRTFHLHSLTFHCIKTGNGTTSISVLGDGSRGITADMQCTYIHSAPNLKVPQYPLGKIVNNSFSQHILHLNCSLYNLKSV